MAAWSTHLTKREKMKSAVLECMNVSAKLGESIILDDITFSMNDGEFIGIIGPNGAGKSTLLRVISGIQKADSGVVRLYGQDIRSMSRQEVARVLAIVAQEESLEFGFTVAEYVSFGRTPHHGGVFFESDQDREIVLSAMSRTLTDNLATRTLESLSGGERQRVRIARTLAQQPRILILDEPTNHLDLYSQMSLMELLREINNSGIAIIMVSHDINFMCQVCNHLKLMSNGQILTAGPSHKVITVSWLEAAFNVKVFVDSNPFTRAPRITPLAKL